MTDKKIPQVDQRQFCLHYKVTGLGKGAFRRLVRIGLFRKLPMSRLQEPARFPTFLQLGARSVSL